MSMWLTTFDVAVMLKIGLRDVWQLVERKILRAHETKTGYRFLWSEVDAYRHRGIS